MAKKKAAKKKTTKRLEGDFPVIRKVTEPRTVTEPRGKLPTITTDPNTSIEKGYEWYDDGGNEGLKKRPIS